MLIFFTLVNYSWHGTKYTAGTYRSEIQMIPIRYGSAKSFFSKQESSRA